MHLGFAPALMLTLEVIDQFPRLAEIEPEWSAFAQTVPDLTPFQLPAWLLTWWAHFGNGQLHVLVFRADGAMVGVIPCFQHEWNGAMQLTLVGSGISDYLEPALDPQHRESIMRALGDHLAATASGQVCEWQVCDWQDLSAATPLRALEVNETFASQITDDVSCSAIHLTGTFEDFRNARPKDLKRNLRRYREKAEAIGKLVFAAVQRADPELMKALVDLHTAKWRKRGEPGMIEANRSAEFLCDVAREFDCRNLLCFFTLRFNGAIVALIVAFRYRKTMYGYLSAFDPKYESFGFGRTLLLETLRYCYASGYESWNFLRGEEPYKFWWGAEPIPKCRLRLTRRS